MVNLCFYRVFAGAKYSMQKIVLVTGGFDPVHSGHLEYIKSARSLGDMLVVGVNSDAWLTRKKGRAFMPWTERSAIIGAMRGVDQVIEFDDSDNSAKDAIRQVRALYPNAQIIFANGGDRTTSNIPEMDTNVTNIDFQFGVGGTNKANSSSWILEDWKAPKTHRDWGHYRVLYEHGKGTKVKELVVEPGRCLSMQRHQNRSEIWFVAQGTASVFTLDKDGERTHLCDFREQQNMMIHRHQWHQLANQTAGPVKIVEIQFGTQCIEEDIERK